MNNVLKSVKLPRNWMSKCGLRLPVCRGLTRLSYQTTKLVQTSPILIPRLASSNAPPSRLLITITSLYTLSPTGTRPDRCAIASARRGRDCSAASRACAARHVTRAMSRVTHHAVISGNCMSQRHVHNPHHLNQHPFLTLSISK